MHEPVNQPLIQERSIVIENLPSRVTTRAVRHLCEIRKQLPVKQIRLVVKPEDPETRYCFLELASASLIDKAVEELSGQFIHHLHVSVVRCTESGTPAPLPLTITNLSKRQQMTKLRRVLEEAKIGVLEHWVFLEEFVVLYEDKDDFRPLKSKYKDVLVSKAVMDLLTDHTLVKNLSYTQLCNMLKVLRILGRMPDNVQTLNKRGLEFLLTILKLYAVKNVMVLSEACAALQNFALDEHNKKKITDMGGVALIQTFLQQHASHPDLITKCCGVLMNLAMREGNREVIKACITLIIDSMKSFMHISPLQKNACGAIRNIALSDANKEMVIQLGAIPLIITVMLIHSDHPEVQANACGCLVNLSRKDDDAKRSIADFKGIDRVLETMRSHKGVPEVQESAIACLRNLAVNDSNMAKIEQTGGIGVIVGMMERHKWRPHVQKSACGALLNLAIRPANRHVIAVAGGIEWIISAMRTHSNSDDIQQHGIGALRNIALNKDLTLRIADQGGIDVILQTMERHKKKVALQVDSCAALWNLCANDALLPIVGQKGGISQIIQALGLHSDHYDLYYLAIGALSCLVSHEENVKRIFGRRAAGLRAILRCLTFYPNKAYTRHNSLELIKTLSRPDYVLSILECQTISSLYNIKKDDLGDDVQLYIDTMSSLRKMVKCIPKYEVIKSKNQQNLSKHEIQVIAVEIANMRRHGKDELDNVGVNELVLHTLIDKQWLLPIIELLACEEERMHAFRLLLDLKQYFYRNDDSEDDEYVSVPKSVRDAYNFTRFLNNKKMSDVTIHVVNGEEETLFYGSRVILSAGSKYFETLLFGGSGGSFKESQENDVTIHDIDPRIFYKILEFLYNLETKIDNEEDVIELLIQADKYQLERLQHYCEWLLKKRYLTSYKKLDGYFQLATKFNSDRLLKFCAAYVIDNFESTLSYFDKDKSKSKAILSLINDDGFLIHIFAYFKGQFQKVEFLKNTDNITARPINHMIEYEAVRVVDSSDDEGGFEE
mmetsp:Transcript_4402/g.4832  ORF Transcript_4402/g.4832 Transcript_4402/m.4832 type:complete len:1004 (+) Transcript_4402:42-3053(+)